MLAKASLSMEPQVGMFMSPSPRKSSPDWMAMAMLAMLAAWMMTGARTTVRMCRRDDAASRSPETRAASTYSSLLTPRTEAYTSR